MIKHVPHSAVQIVCDFDGTITDGNVMEFIAARFASCGLAYSEAWERKEISTREEFELTFKCIDASLDDMAASLVDVPYDEGLSELVAYCHSRGYTFSILSDGLRWYIDAVLANAGVQDVYVYANEVRQTENGFAFDFPWYSDETPRLATCKPLVMRDIRKQGKRVMYIGDGPSDFQAVHFADMVFAKPRLAAYCSEKRLVHLGFETFKDILANWPWLD